MSPLPSTIANEHPLNLTHPFLVLTHSPLKLTHLYNIDSTSKKLDLLYVKPKNIRPNLKQIIMKKIVLSNVKPIKII